MLCGMWPRRQKKGDTAMLSKARTELVEIHKFSIVWILVVQLINKPAWAKNQLHQNPNIAKLGRFYRLYV